MSPPLRLRFLNHVTDPVMLICEGGNRPTVGQLIRAVGSEGNGFMVVAVVDHVPGSPETFGIKLKRNEIPWPPNTPIEVVAG